MQQQQPQQEKPKVLESKIKDKVGPGIVRSTNVEAVRKADSVIVDAGRCPLR